MVRPAAPYQLLADPIDLPVIEVAFLNGEEAPTIETADADLNVPSVQMCGYHDFAVNPQEPSVGRANIVPSTWGRGEVRVLKSSAGGSARGKMVEYPGNAPQCNK